MDLLWVSEVVPVVLLAGAHLSQPRSASDAAQAAVPEGELAARYWDRVRLFALRRVGDPDAAEDIAQEAIRVAAEALRAGRVESLDSLPGYVFRTALHLCQRRFRSQGREARALGRLSTGLGLEQRPADPLVALITEERRAAVRTAMAHLALSDRELLTLLYFEDIDTTTAAARLEVTPDTLRVRKHRALRRLAVWLGDVREDVTP